MIAKRSIDQALPCHFSHTPLLPFHSDRHTLTVSRFLVLAGSESPARSLAIIHFHILNTPGCLQKLREELRTVGSSPQLKDLEQFPYLNACVIEGNRLSFGLTRRMYRTAPEDTLMYKEHAIPPGTPVAISTLAVMADPDIFPDPWTFKPERWLGSGAKELRKYLASFGFKNSWACLESAHWSHHNYRHTGRPQLMGYIRRASTWRKPK